MRVGSPRQMHNPYNTCDRQEARIRHGMRSRRCTRSSMHEVDRGVYYDRYVYYDMGMLAWHAAVRRYPRLAIGRLGGSRARRILDGLPAGMVASPCCREGGLRSMQHHYGTGGRHDRGDAPAGIWTLNPRLECRDGRRAGRGCQRESACLRVGAGPQARGSGRRPTLLSLGWGSAGRRVCGHPGPVRHPGLGYMRWVRQQ